MRRRVRVALCLLAFLAAPDAAHAVQATPNETGHDSASLLSALEVGSLAARRASAREALRAADLAVLARLEEILEVEDGLTPHAVALALGDQAQAPPLRLAPALLGLLHSDRGELRAAAAAALGWSRDEDTIARLTLVTQGHESSTGARVAAIEALREIPSRSAAVALAAVLNDADAEVRGAALTAMEQLAGREFAGDCGAAADWWRAHADMDERGWAAFTQERMARDKWLAQERLREVEALLAKALRDAVLRTPDAERAALLQSYLKDSSLRVRLIGLEILQTRFAEGAPPPPESVSRLRELLAAPEPEVRRNAARALAGLRDPTDAERFVALLQSETRGEVREAAVYGLGYCGRDECVPLLTAFLSDANAAIAVEAAVALGRLAERGELSHEVREMAIDGLQRQGSRVGGWLPESHERWLRAVARIADASFEPWFLDTMALHPAATVRAAGARGLSGLVGVALRDDSAADEAFLARARAALRGALDDNDAAVRSAAIDAFAALVDDRDDVEQVSRHSHAALEPDSGVRELAWNALLGLLERLPVSVSLGVVDCAPSATSDDVRRRLELMTSLEQRLSSQPDACPLRGEIRMRVARDRAALDQRDEALNAYAAALSDLEESASSLSAECRSELIGCALAWGAAEDPIAAAIAFCPTPIDLEAIWRWAAPRLDPATDLGGAVAVIELLEAAAAGGIDDVGGGEFKRHAASARRDWAEQNERAASAAIAALIANPGDDALRAPIEDLGARAVAALARALRELVVSNDAPAGAESALRELLREAAPNWPAYGGSASQEEKLEALKLIPPSLQ